MYHDKDGVLFRNLLLLLLLLKNLLDIEYQKIQKHKK